MVIEGSVNYMEMATETSSTGVLSSLVVVCLSFVNAPVSLWSGWAWVPLKMNSNSEGTSLENLFWLNSRSSGQVEGRRWPSEECLRLGLVDWIWVDDDMTLHGGFCVLMDPFLTWMMTWYGIVW